jgi:protoporphyrinogen IX oxidase
VLLWITKLVHVTAISLWAGGLIALPFLLRQKHDQRGEPLHRLHRLVRLLYVGWLSPAAFLGIGSGVVLIFLRETFTEWFTLKLLFVGALAALHVRIGLLILSVFDPGGRLSPWGARLLTLATLAAVGAILVAVLWKPEIPSATWAPGLFRPGALGEMWPRISAWVTP